MNTTAKKVKKPRLLKWQKEKLQRLKEGKLLLSGTSQEDIDKYYGILLRHFTWYNGLTKEEKKQADEQAKRATSKSIEGIQKLADKTKELGETIARTSATLACLKTRLVEVSAIF